MRTEDITTAPKDGTRFLAWFTNPELVRTEEFPVIVRYYQHSFAGDCWEWNDGCTVETEGVTGYWMMLPVLDQENSLEAKE